MAHFYEETDNGVEARHFVQMASRPDLRPTRITDVRKWWKEGREVVPSVTTILNVLDKAALVNWKVDQHLIQAYAWKDTDDPFEDWLLRVKRSTEMELEKAPQAGTDVHKVLEDFVKGMEPPEELAELCENVWNAIMGATDLPQPLWDVEKRFTDNRGFGGCADLVNIEREPWVIDYKTKQTADKFKPGKMAYPDHSRQLAAYREGLGIPNARCANVFICIETGEVDFHEHTEEQLRNGWQVFNHALAIWQLTNDYPMTETKAA